MIPANIDYVAIVEELNAWGMGDYKLELICGFSEGYLRHLKNGSYRDMTYQRAARLYNFWCDERQARGMQVFTALVPLFAVSTAEKNQVLAATT
jgi:hypothetical protein